MADFYESQESQGSHDSAQGALPLKDAESTGDSHQSNSETIKGKVGWCDMQTKLFKARANITCMQLSEALTEISTKANNNATATIESFTQNSMEKLIKHPSYGTLSRIRTIMWNEVDPNAELSKHDFAKTVQSNYNKKLEDRYHEYEGKISGCGNPVSFESSKACLDNAYKEYTVRVANQTEEFKANLDDAMDLLGKRQEELEDAQESRLPYYFAYGLLGAMVVSTVSQAIVTYLNYRIAGLNYRATLEIVGHTKAMEEKLKPE